VESGGRGVEEVYEIGGDGGHGQRVAADRWNRGSANRIRSTGTRIFDETDHLRQYLVKRTTSEKDCQKRPVLSGGTPGQATRGTCRLGQSRQGGAATYVAGMWLARAAVGPAASLPPPSLPASC
jgi:hypothetical protein